MSDRVLVVLDRKEAAQLRVMVRHETGCRYMADDRYPCDCLRGRLFAALDRDREELAAVIEQTQEAALTAMWGDGYEGVEDDVWEALWAAAPLLVEHGRQQAKTRWETRIEAEADERDRLGNLPGAEEIYRLAEVHAAAVLRSLLTEEEALHAD